MRKSKDYYVTFGQVHTHSVDGKTFDRDCVAVVRASDYGEARKIAFKTFGAKWAFIYEEVPDVKKFYGRGLMALNFKEESDEKE